MAANVDVEQCRSVQVSVDVGRQIGPDRAGRAELPGRAKPG